LGKYFCHPTVKLSKKSFTYQPYKYVCLYSEGDSVRALISDGHIFLWSNIQREGNLEPDEVNKTAVGIRARDFGTFLVKGNRVILWDQYWAFNIVLVESGYPGLDPSSTEREAPNYAVRIDLKLKVIRNGNPGSIQICPILDDLQKLSSVLRLFQAAE
jgi:hypothetical protein